MEGGELVELIGELSLVVASLSGYPVPDTPVEVHRVPQVVIQELVCKKTCRVPAFYHPDFGVLVSDELDLRNDTFHQSILVHELVHHSQKLSGRFETLASECHKRAAAESEAYEIQNRFLAARQSQQRVPRIRGTQICPD
jgi:hypothetical protein